MVLGQEILVLLNREHQSIRIKRLGSYGAEIQLGSRAALKLCVAAAEKFHFKYRLSQKRSSGLLVVDHYLVSLHRFQF